MAVSIVDWGAQSVTSSYSQRVYIRKNWATWNDSTQEFDDVPWIPMPSLWCEAASWALLPNMPSAQFTYDYGRILDPSLSGSVAYQYLPKLNIGGWYVKVEFDAPDGVITWFGFIDEVADEQGGRFYLDATGRQTFVAFGMPQILAHQYVTQSRWHDEPYTEYRDSGSAIAFNDAGRPNRSAEMVHPDDEPYYVFVPPSVKTATLDKAWKDAQYWTTLTICTHLMQYNAPKDQAGRKRIPFALMDSWLLPDWDKPTVQTEGRSVLTILNELVNPGRMLQMSTTIDDSVVPNVVQLKVHSLSHVAIPTPVGVHYANEDQAYLVTVDAPDTQAIVQYSETDRVNQVVVKGAKREVMARLGVCSGANTTAEGFIEAFQQIDIDAYNDAASNDPVYAGLDDTQRQQVNAAVRGSSQLIDVYRTLALNPLWTDWRDVFVEGDNLNLTSAPRYHPYWGAVTVARHLPIKQGVDYTQPLVVDDAESEYRSPYVLFEVPEQPGVFQVAERIADGESVSWSVSVGIGKYGQALVLDVQGDQQHVIAKTHFVPLSEDYGADPEYDYLNARLSVSVTDDRYAEVVYPPSSALVDRDVIRQHLIYAGPAYRQVQFQFPDVDVDASGKPQFIHPTFDINDKDKLEAIAYLAAAWHATPRKVLRLASARPSARVFVGQIVVALNATSVQSDLIGTVISEIRYRMGKEEGGGASAPSFTVTTAAGELDPLAFTPEVPEP